VRASYFILALLIAAVAVGNGHTAGKALVGGDYVMVAILYTLAIGNAIGAGIMLIRALDYTKLNPNVKPPTVIDPHIVMTCELCRSPFVVKDGHDCEKAGRLITPWPNDRRGPQ
jgi:hypothetical protein